MIRTQPAFLGQSTCLSVVWPHLSYISMPQLPSPNCPYLSHTELLSSHWACLIFSNLCAFACCFSLCLEWLSPFCMFLKIQFKCYCLCKYFFSVISHYSVHSWREREYLCLPGPSIMRGTFWALLLLAPGTSYMVLGTSYMPGHILGAGKTVVE